VSEATLALDEKEAQPAVDVRMLGEEDQRSPSTKKEVKIHQVPDLCRSF
jgi:hypothetical protein